MGPPWGADGISSEEMDSAFQPFFVLEQQRGEQETWARLVSRDGTAMVSSSATFLLLACSRDFRRPKWRYHAAKVRKRPGGGVQAAVLRE